MGLFCLMKLLLVLWDVMGGMNNRFLNEYGGNKYKVLIVKKTLHQGYMCYIVAIIDINNQSHYHVASIV